MDYETKIYLDNLIEAVEKLNSPDWWTIGITVVNALIMIWLGWKQYKIQLQQNKLTRYNENKQLYSLIKDINTNSRRILMEIYRRLKIFSPDAIFFHKQNELWKEMQEDFKNRSEDLKFKVNMSNDEHNAYGVMLMFSQLAMCLIEEYIKNGYIVKTKEIPFNEDFNDDTFIQCILSIVIEDKKSDLEKVLNSVKNAKTDLLKHDVLKRIEKLCTL